MRLLIGFFLRYCLARRVSNLSTRFNLLRRTRIKLVPNRVQRVNLGQIKSLPSRTSFDISRFFLFTDPGLMVSLLNKTHFPSPLPFLCSLHPFVAIPNTRYRLTRNRSVLSNRYFSLPESISRNGSFPVGQLPRVIRHRITISADSTRPREPTPPPMLHTRLELV